MLKGVICRYPESGQNISLQYPVYYNNIALPCVNSIVMLLNLLANGFVVFRYYQTRARQPVSNTLIFLLASFDFLQGAVAQPLFILSYILEFFGILNCSLHETANMVECILLGFSFLMVAVVLTTERLVAVVYPIYHRVYMRRKVLIFFSITLFGVWTAIMIILHVVLLPDEIFYINVFVLSSGLVYTVAVYIKIFRVSRASARIQSSGSYSMENFGLSTNENKRETIEKNSGLNSGNFHFKFLSSTQ